MTSNLNLNDRAVLLAGNVVERSAELRIDVHDIGGVQVLDFGVDARGGLSAGLILARMCMADLAEINVQSAGSLIDVPNVVVHTDHPLHACLMSQYAGWKIATDDYFAMGSGPMRVTAGSEDLFQEFPATDPSLACVGVLEAGSLPTQSATAAVRSGVGEDKNVILAVAPTSSQAGNLQVVARSVETAMHKLHELHFPVEKVVSGCGVAPLPPVAKGDLEGIGRTNDSILYGTTVNLWVDCEDEVIEEFGPQTPSNSSDSHGQPFLKLFKEANHDFYALDKNLFSPAVVIFHNLSTGRSFRFGDFAPQLLHDSFGI